MSESTTKTQRQEDDGPVCNGCYLPLPKDWRKEGWIKCRVSLTHHRGTITVYQCPKHQGMEYLNPFRKKEAA
jgi:hypothetical protein